MAQVDPPKEATQLILQKKLIRWKNEWPVAITLKNEGQQVVLWKNILSLQKFDASNRSS